MGIIFVIVLIMSLKLQELGRKLEEALSCSWNDDSSYFLAVQDKGSLVGHVYVHKFCVHPTGSWA